LLKCCSSNIFSSNSSDKNINHDKGVSKEECEGVRKEDGSKRKDGSNGGSKNGNKGGSKDRTEGESSQKEIVGKGTGKNKKRVNEITDDNDLRSKRAVSNSKKFC
jgi:hypothetical protein